MEIQVIKPLLILSSVNIELEQNGYKLSVIQNQNKISIQEKLFVRFTLFVEVVIIVPALSVFNQENYLQSSKCWKRVLKPKSSQKIISLMLFLDFIGIIKNTLRYIKLTDTMSHRRSWTNDQDNMICQAIEAHGIQKWPKTLNWIKSKSSFFNRTAKQIRERWKYHLDPTINSQNWTMEQQKIIFNAHRMHGSKWKEIQKLLPGRTQKAIKNQFYKNLRKSIRRINKSFGVKNSTNQVRQVKPCVINMMIELGNQDPTMRESIYHLFHFNQINSTNPDLQIPQKICSEEMVLLRNFIDQLFCFNELCLISKQQGVKIFKQKIKKQKTQYQKNDGNYEKSSKIQISCTNFDFRQQISQNSSNLIHQSKQSLNQFSDLVILEKEDQQNSLQISRFNATNQISGINQFFIP